MNDQLCSICQTATSQIICFCREVRVCALCISKHLLQEPSLAHKPLPLASGDLIESARMLGCKYEQPREETDSLKRAAIERELRRLQSFQTDALIQLHRMKVHYEAELARTVNLLSQSLSAEVSRLTAALEACSESLSDRTPSPCLDSVLSQRLQSIARLEEVFETKFEIKLINLEAIIRQSIVVALGLKERKVESSKLFKFFGGSNSVGVFDAEKGTYEKLTTTGQKFLHNSCWCAAPSGDLIITGGSLTGHSRNTVLSFSPLAGALEELDSMQIARRSHASVCAGGFCYVFGGVMDEETISLCERYDLERKVWTPLPQMKERRAYLGCCEYKGLLIACGGSETSSSFEVFDPVQLAFQVYSVPQINLCDVASLAPLEDSVLIFHGNFNGEVSRLLPSAASIAAEQRLCYGNSWSSCPPLLHKQKVYLLRSDSIFTYDLTTGVSAYLMRMMKTQRKRDYE